MQGHFCTCCNIGEKLEKYFGQYQYEEDGIKENGIYKWLRVLLFYLDVNINVMEMAPLEDLNIEFFLSPIFEAQRFRVIGFENQRVLDLDTQSPQIYDSKYLAL